MAYGARTEAQVAVHVAVRRCHVAHRGEGPECGGVAIGRRFEGREEEVQRSAARLVAGVGVAAVLHEPDQHLHKAANHSRDEVVR